MKKSVLGWHSKLKLYLPKSSDRKFLSIVLIALTIPVTVLLVKQVTNLMSKAQLTTAELFFTPSTQIMPPNSDFALNVDVGPEQVTFTRVVVTFDPSAVRLTGEIQTNPILSTVVEKTTMTQANNTGVATVVIALPPGNIDNPPTGVFTLLTMPMKAQSTEVNLTTTLSVVDAEVQIVTLPGDELPSTSESAVITLNFVPSATPSQTPTPTFGPSPTFTPTPIPTTGPTSTPTPTPRGQTPTPTPTVGPGTPTPTTGPTSTNTPTPTVTVPPTATNTPTPTTGNEPGDVNGDGIVNIVDIGIIVDAYSTSPPSDPRADLNRDNVVNIVDIGIVVDNYGN